MVSMAPCTISRAMTETSAAAVAESEPASPGNPKEGGRSHSQARSQIQEGGPLGPPLAHPSLGIRGSGAHSCGASGTRWSS
eukprot:4421207-Pyramimonas_sp.AAC.1